MEGSMVVWSSALAVWLGFVVVGTTASRIFKRYDVADFLWGLAFLAFACGVYFGVGADSFKSDYILFLIALWSLRLSGYVGLRLMHTTEDRRYNAWRKSWGNQEALKSFGKIFLLQPVFAVVIFLPVAYQLAHTNAQIHWYDFVGMTVFLVGFFVEMVADGQLYHFKKLPKSKGMVMNKGLWAYSQHPNYFGEWLIWVGLAFLCYEAVGYFSIAMPLIMLYVLVELTGIKMKSRFINHYSGYDEYVKNTPIFFPFTVHSLLVLLWAIIIVQVIDFVWINFIAGGFYWDHYQALARMADGTWDVLLWPAILVYLFIPVGVVYFAVKPSFWVSVWDGFCFGFLSYGIYDLTNMALLKHWSLESVMVDVAWGGFLCAISAAIVCNVSHFFKHHKSV